MRHPRPWNLLIKIIITIKNNYYKLLLVNNTTDTFYL